MASTYTTRLRAEKQGTGENSGTWGTKLNTLVAEVMEEAIAGVAAVAMTDANYTLTTANGSTDEARRAVIQLTGALTAQRNVVCPTVQKLYAVFNNTSGSQSIVFKTTAGTGITIGNGKKRLVYCDGTNVVDMFSDLPTGTTLNGTAFGTAALVNTGTSGATAALCNGVNTWAGIQTFSVAPVFTDASGSRTALGLVIGTNVQAYDADLTTWAGLTPSANFQTMVPHTFAQMRTDLGLVIGTNVQAYDADLDTWAGITPAANVGTFLATPSSANLIAAVTDETGTGALVFGTSPTIGTPTINGGTSSSRIQLSGETTGTLTSASANKKILATGGITLPNSVFAAQDAIIIEGNGTARTITRGASVTMYINGVDSATGTLTANGVMGVHWRTASICILTGNIS